MDMLSDFNIALYAWLFSLVVAWVLPDTLPVVAATTFNLCYQRYILYNAGAKLAHRVREILQDDMNQYSARFHKLEKDVFDVKDAQIAIAGQFRGRGHPHAGS